MPDYRDGRDEPGHDQVGLPRVLLLYPSLDMAACGYPAGVMAGLVAPGLHPGAIHALLADLPQE